MTPRLLYHTGTRPHGVVWVDDIRYYPHDAQSTSNRCSIIAAAVIVFGRTHGSPSFTSSFPGKEAIATVGVRIGRTAAHVTLYLFSAALGGAPPQRVLMGMALITAVLWAVTLKRVEVLASEGGGSSQHAGRIDMGDVATGRLSTTNGANGVSSDGVGRAERREKARRKRAGRKNGESNGAGATVVGGAVSAVVATPPVVFATANNSHVKGGKEL